MPQKLSLKSYKSSNLTFLLQFFIIIYLLQMQPKTPLNTDQIHPIHSSNTLISPIIDIQAEKQIEKQQIKKSKRIAKIKHKTNQMQLKNQKEPLKKQRKNKRNLQREKSKSNLSEPHLSQRQSIATQIKGLRQTKKQKKTRAYKPQSVNLISLISDLNDNRRQEERLSGRPVQRSRRLFTSDDNLIPINRGFRETERTSDAEYIREPSQNVRSLRFGRTFSILQPSQEQDQVFSHLEVPSERGNLLVRNVIEPSPYRRVSPFDGHLGIDKGTDQQNLKWFISKNTTYPVTDLTPQKIDKCDKCIICYTDWANPDEMKEQKVESLQCSNDQTNDKHLLIELFCSHCYHKSCIENWFKTKTVCPCCRKDFRKHDAYKQWDVNYEKRIKSQLLSSRMFSFDRSWEPAIFNFGLGSGNHERLQSRTEIDNGGSIFQDFLVYDVPEPGSQLIEIIERLPPFERLISYSIQNSSSGEGGQNMVGQSNWGQIFGFNSQFQI